MLEIKIRRKEMKKQGTKLAIALLALMCVGAGTTAVVAADNANSYVTANAETAYTEYKMFFYS